MKIEQIKDLVSGNGNMRALSATASDVSDEETIVVEGVAIIANYIDKHGSIFTTDCLTESLSEIVIHNADHVRDFEHLISNSVEVAMREIPLSELGESLEGNATAFCFKSEFSKEDNPAMFRQYKRKRVKYHSIEFDWSRRGAEILCVASTFNAPEEYKENWDKYYPTVLNKEVADSRGWFYVYEKAPIIAVSAVVLGSNKVTPTLSTRGYSEEMLKVELELAPVEAVEEVVKIVEPEAVRQVPTSIFSRLK